jgi:PKD repeat protein
LFMQRLRVFFAGNRFNDFHYVIHIINRIDPLSFLYFRCFTRTYNMPLPMSFFAKRFFFVFTLFLLHTCVFGQSGKDGAKIIGSVNAIVNDYTNLTSSASAGSSSIQVANNSLSSGFAAPLSTGDLLFIIQVQGASIITADDPTNGTISSYNNCGNNELAEVRSVSGTNSITLYCPLQHDFSASGKTVVVRVPRFSSLTVNGGANLTCPAWNGTTGGILAIEVTGTTIINGGGTIDVTGKGFRGGALLDVNTNYGVLNYSWPTNDYGGEKGEGIAGSVLDYDVMNGRYCKGAPANGGGGGNGHNGGGGGGANAGNISNYTGFGNPDNSNASWASAWNLESAGFASSTSSGGGKGGYTFSGSNQNALAVGPFNPAWGGDQRRDNGGRGGRPLDYSNGRIFLGGGGGAGEQNNAIGGAGGNGGGIILMQTYAGISGSGQINANGANGASTLGSNGTDGAGGGGGGGTILLRVASTITGVTINANGGNGGSQNVLPFTAEAEGPGGGGGGGYIAVSGGTISRNANGGNNGSTNSTSLSEFPPNGATRGGAGINSATLTTFKLLTQTVSVCDSNTATLTFTTVGTAPSGVVYSWYDQAAGGVALGTGTTFTTPPITSPRTYYIGYCPGAIRFSIQVNVSPGPSATFTSNTACAGNPTNFIATGSGGVNSWSWNFGDGSPASTQQNPSHTYSSGGTYTVTLTISNGLCTKTVSQVATVNNQPTASFTSSASGGCGPLNVSFNNGSTNAGTYSWNFGDGSPANTQNNPSHAYVTGGTYTVVLTAIGSGCTATQSHTISVGQSPTSSFTANTTVCLNDTVFFTNHSVANGSAITSYNWNFGDGSPASSSANPTHVYVSSGTFTVRLTAATAGCSDDTTITVNVNPAPVVNFAHTAVSNCAPSTVNFINSTSGSPVYTWNFGDGSPASSQINPSHTYNTPGNYTVTLIATQGSCADTLIEQNGIIIYNKPIASFSTAASICLGDTLSFVNNSLPNGAPITSYNWNFGDGSPTSGAVNPNHYYSVAGNYTVTLSASNANCTDDTTFVISVSPGPIASFNTSTTSACENISVSFSNNSTGTPTYSWNFGDGSPLSNQINPIHTYTNAGTFTVTLIATQGSCSDTLQQLNYIQIYNHPVSSFSTSNVCEGDSARFINSSDDQGNPINSYSWDFGDGNSSNDFSPAHYYTSTGNYTVRLTVNSANCSDDTTITINVSSAPVLDFISDINRACDSAFVHFTNNSTGAASYLWYFGDGDSSIFVNPTHSYSTPGTYSVTLNAIASGGCRTTRSVFSMINVYPTPVATISASATSICENNCISISAQTSPGATSWTWSFPGGNPSSSVAQNPGSVCYNASSSYNVSLTVSNGFCESNQVLNSYIHVVDCSTLPKADFISGDTVMCEGSCIDFVSLSSNATSWNWIFAGGTPASSTLENPISICYASQGYFPVTLIATNPAGSDTIFYNDFIEVKSLPATPTIFQNGDSLTSSSAAAYQWYFNGTAISGATSQEFTALLSGDYYVIIEDEYGCSSVSAIRHVSLVGIEETEHLFHAGIFPNPAHDKINIQLSTKKPMNLTISIVNILGSTLNFKHVSMNSIYETVIFNAEELSQGIYFIKIDSGTDRLILPVIKQ